MNLRSIGCILKLSRQKGHTLLLLIVLAEESNDQGQYDGAIDTLAEQCDLSRRSITSFLQALESSEILTITRIPGRLNVLNLNPCKLCMTPRAPMQTVHGPYKEYIFNNDQGNNNIDIQ